VLWAVGGEPQEAPAFDLGGGKMHFVDGGTDMLPRAFAKQERLELDADLREQLAAAGTARSEIHAALDGSDHGP